jgi:hypothetical protein
MGELANALRTIGNLPLVLTQNPNNTWSFVGRVPVQLKYVKADGSLPTDNEIAELLRAQMPSLVMKRYGIHTRVFQSKQDALDAATEIGATVQQVSPNR